MTGHPSAGCLSDPSAATGLQHDVEATPKGSGIPLNTKNPYAVAGGCPAPDRHVGRGRVAATTRASAGSSDAPQGGLELIDITNVEAPVEIALTSHIGEAHTVNVDPKRPHIAYVSSSDQVGVDEEGSTRANEDPDGQPDRLRRHRGRRHVLVHEPAARRCPRTSAAPRAAPRSTATAGRRRSTRSATPSGTRCGAATSSRCIPRTS